VVPAPPDDLDVDDLRDLCAGARDDLETAEECLKSVIVSPKSKKLLWSLANARIRGLLSIERVIADVLHDTASDRTCNAYYWIIQTLDGKARFDKTLIHEYTRRRGGLDDLIRYKAFLRRLVLNHWEVLDSLSTVREPLLDVVRDQVAEMEATLKNLAWLTSIFVCYAREDEKTLNLLADIIQVPLRAKHVFLWWDRKPQNGYDTDPLVSRGIISTANWEDEIERRLETFDFAISLTSKSFDRSPFIGGTELPKVLANRASRGMRVLPVRLEKCDAEKISDIWRTQWFPAGEDDRLASHINESGFDPIFRQRCEGELVNDIGEVMVDMADLKKVEEFIRAWQPSTPPDHTDPGGHVDPQAPGGLAE
jgi:hypothetical protein